MSLEALITENTAAMNRLAAALEGHAGFSADAPAKTKKSKKTETNSEPAPAAAPAATTAEPDTSLFEKLKKRVVALATTKRDEVIAALDKAEKGCKKLSDMKPENWATFDELTQPLIESEAKDDIV